jgi:hypothetical protein
MTAFQCDHRIERRAEVAGCEIHDIPHTSRAFVFSCLGQPPRIYIPADLPAPYHGYAVLAMVDRLVTRGCAEDERRALCAAGRRPAPRAGRPGRGRGGGLAAGVWYACFGTGPEEEVPTTAAKDRRSPR